MKHCCLKKIVLVVECYPVEILATKRGSSNINLHYVTIKMSKVNIFNSKSVQKNISTCVH